MIEILKDEGMKTSIGLFQNDSNGNVKEIAH